MSRRSHAPVLDESNESLHLPKLQVERGRSMAAFLVCEHRDEITFVYRNLTMIPVAGREWYGTA